MPKKKRTRATPPSMSPAPPPPPVPERFHAEPTPEDKDELIKNLRLYFGVQAIKQVPILNILFERDGKPIDGNTLHGRLKSKSDLRALHNTIYNLRDNLKTFSEEHPQRYNVGIAHIPKESGNPKSEAGYVLTFTTNTHPRPNLRDFWQHYFQAGTPTRLYFPEPQFFKHRSGTYVRHPKAHWPTDHGQFKELLNLNRKDLILSYSFVPSGTASSLSRLYECFHENNATLKAAPRLPTDIKISPMERNVIVLGTPTTSWSLLESQSCEGMHGAALRSGWDEVENKNFFAELDHNGAVVPPLYTDEEEGFDGKSGPVPLTKYAVLTRRKREHCPGAYMTVLSGHSHSILMLAEYLTRERTVSELFTHFKNQWPEEFQVLFMMPMQKQEGLVTHIPARHHPRILIGKPIPITG